MHATTQIFINEILLNEEYTNVNEMSGRASIADGSLRPKRILLEKAVIHSIENKITGIIPEPS